MKLNKIDLNILKNVSDLTSIPTGAVNIRLNGEAVIRNSTTNISVKTNDKNNGLLVEIKPGSKNETVHVPVILSDPGLQETVYNTFIVGEDAEAEIIAGCGIHTSCASTSRHDGVHEIIVRRGARLKYSEKHYGEGNDEGKRILNPSTIITIEKGGYAELEMLQIKGVDDTKRSTVAHIHEKGNLKIIERLLTHGQQIANSKIEVFLEGLNSNAQIISRGVAQENSRQLFRAALIGQAACNGHLECDAIIMDNAFIQSIPELRAENADAILTHEAAIGKVAGEQLLKLMSLGLTEAQALDAILQGFLK
jgi:Fe-S cluster assembly scaffold protein SufB